MIKKFLKISQLQIEGLADPLQNTELIKKSLLKTIKFKPDIISTPECSNIITNDKKHLIANATFQNACPVLKECKKFAKKYNKIIHIGSLLLKKNHSNKLINRSFIIGVDGKIKKYYDKIHLFDVNINKKEKYRESEDIYRALKISLQFQSLGEDTSKMFLREMIVKRKQLPRFSPLRFAHKFAHLAFGYGEKIGNILYSILVVLVTCTLIYGINGVDYQERNLSFFADDIQEYGYLKTFGNLFYFSVVVFSTVGFGEITPLGLLNKSVMIFEGLTGGIITTILIIAIYRQLMDR